MMLECGIIQHYTDYPRQCNNTKAKSKLQRRKDIKLLIILGNMIAHVQNQKHIHKYKNIIVNKRFC